MDERQNLDLEYVPQFRTPRWKQRYISAGKTLLLIGLSVLDCRVVAQPVRLHDRPASACPLDVGELINSEESGRQTHASVTRLRSEDGGALTAPLHTHINSQHP